MGSSEIQVRSLSQEDPLEKEVATLSSILAWKKKSYCQRSLAGCKELAAVHKHESSS